MKRFPYAVNPTETLAQARNFMVWGEFRHLPVVDGGRLVGLVTDRDLTRYRAEHGDRAFNDPISAIMERHVHTAGPDDSVTEATARLASTKEGCLPITERGELIGIVTTTDVLAAEVQLDMMPTNGDETTAGDVMTQYVEVVDPNDLLTDAAGTMQQYRIRHLPVVDSDGELVGMLSDTDVRTAVGDPVAAFLGEPISSVPVNMLRVADAMTSPAPTVQAKESCKAAARMLTLGPMGAVAVVDDDDQLVGVASYIDILQAFAH